jgi:hypothetical protein
LIAFAIWWALLKILFSFYKVWFICSNDDAVCIYCDAYSQDSARITYELCLTEFQAWEYVLELHLRGSRDLRG